jgi:hypothetical protein
MRTALAVIAVAFSASSAHATGGTTALTILVRTAPDAAPHVLTLRCNPARGTVAMPGAACRRLLSAGRAIFAPTPAGSACSQIYGGHQVAVITGTLDGQRLWTSFRRRDGCEVARWSRVAFLLGSR